MKIKDRLSNDMHVKRTAQEYRDCGDCSEIVIAQNGMSESDVESVGCYFKLHLFPVRVVERMVVERMSMDDL